MTICQEKHKNNRPTFTCRANKIQKLFFINVFFILTNKQIHKNLIHVSIRALYYERRCKGNAKRTIHQILEQQKSTNIANSQPFPEQRQQKQDTEVNLFRMEYFTLLRYYITTFVFCKIHIGYAEKRIIYLYYIYIIIYI